MSEVEETIKNDVAIKILDEIGKSRSCQTRNQRNASYCAPK
jgi:hypothetical protein